MEGRLSVSVRCHYQDQWARGGSGSVASRSRLPPHSLSCHCRVMLDSVTHSTFLPNTSFCDPLMSWTDLFSHEEYYPAFEHQTGACIWRSPPGLGRAGAGGCGPGPVTMPCKGPTDAWGRGHLPQRKHRNPHPNRPSSTASGDSAHPLSLAMLSGKMQMTTPISWSYYM